MSAGSSSCCQMVRTAMEAQVSVETGVTQSTETTGPFSSTYCG